MFFGFLEEPDTKQGVQREKRTKRKWIKEKRD